MNNYKSFSELKEELGDNYDFKLYEMGISALKEIENLQQENKQLKIQISAREEEYRKLEREFQELKLINKEYERLNKENGRGFKITSVKQYNIDELLKCEDNWNKLKTWLNNFHRLSAFEQWEIVNKMQELQGSGINDSN
jgi:predicted RNase H-like nuclease (RuvC/YqgF family)